MHYWYQIFALDSAVVEIQEMFSSHGSLLTNAMYHHGETLLIVVWLFLAVPWVCLQFVIVVFPDHSHLLYL